MKDFFQSFKLNTSVSAIISLAIGLALLLRPGSFTVLVCRAIALLLLVSGIVAVVSYMRESQKIWRVHLLLLIGVVLILLGISMLAQPAFFISLLPLVLGIFVLIHSLQDVGYAMNLKKLNDSHWWITMLVAVLGIVLALIVIINPFMAASTVTMMIGAVLVYDGISDLCVVVHLRNTTKRFRRDVADYFGQMQEDARDGVVYTEDAKEED